MGVRNCSSSNIIFLFVWHFCPKQYIGVPKRSLSCRFNNHRLDLLYQRPSRISSHLNKWMCKIEDCQIWANFKCPTLTTEELTTLARRVIDQYFILTFKTYLPYGLHISTTMFKDVTTSPLVLPYSGLASIAVRVITKHYKELHERKPHIFHSSMVAVFSRNCNIEYSLVSPNIR